MEAVFFQSGDAGQEMVVSEMADVEPHAKQVRIKVHAFGINRADLLQKKGHYPPPPGASDVPGLEVSGIVDKVGEGVTSVTCGQRVCGLVSGGGYATHCLVDEALLLPLPDTWSFEEGAAAPEACITASASLFQQAQLKTGERVLIQAASSGVGSTMVQMALYIGADVVVTAGTAEKIEKLHRLGVETAYHYDLLYDAEKQRAGFDVIVDFFGGEQLQQHMAMMRLGGRMVTLALMKGAEGMLNFRQMMKKHLTLSGFILRSRTLEEKAAMVDYVRSFWWPLLSERHFLPIIDRVFSWREIETAHQYMQQRQHFGKLVVSFDDT